jgi:hypothetical protein
VSNEQPQSPMTVLAQGATAMHEMFRAYVEAGFTEQQALQIVIQIAVAGIEKRGGAP